MDTASTLGFHHVLNARFDLKSDRVTGLRSVPCSLPSLSPAWLYLFRYLLHRLIPQLVVSHVPCCTS